MLVRIHYDGWLALPPTVCRRLGLKTGDQVEVEPSADGVFLRRAKRAAAETMVSGLPAATATSEPQGKLAKASARSSKTRSLATKEPKERSVLPPTAKAGGKRSRTDENGEDAAHPS